MVGGEEGYCVMIEWVVVNLFLSEVDVFNVNIEFGDLVLI